MRLLARRRRLLDDLAIAEAAAAEWRHNAHQLNDGLVRAHRIIDGLVTILEQERAALERVTRERDEANIRHLSRGLTGDTVRRLERHLAPFGVVPLTRPLPRWAYPRFPTPHDGPDDPRMIAPPLPRDIHDALTAARWDTTSDA